MGIVCGGLFEHMRIFFLVEDRCKGELTLFRMHSIRSLVTQILDANGFFALKVCLISSSRALRDQRFEGQHTNLQHERWKIDIYRDLGRWMLGAILFPHRGGQE